MFLHVVSYVRCGCTDTFIKDKMSKLNSDFFKDCTFEKPSATLDSSILYEAVKDDPVFKVYDTSSFSKNKKAIQKAWDVLMEQFMTGFRPLPKDIPMNIHTSIMTKKCFRRSPFQPLLPYKDVSSVLSSSVYKNLDDNVKGMKGRDVCDIIQPLVDIQKGIIIIKKCNNNLNVTGELKDKYKDILSDTWPSIEKSHDRQCEHRYSKDRLLTPKDRSHYLAFARDDVTKNSKSCAKDVKESMKTR